MMTFQLSKNDWVWLCEVLSMVYHDIESDEDMKEDIMRVASALGMVESAHWKINN